MKRYERQGTKNVRLLQGRWGPARAQGDNKRTNHLAKMRLGVKTLASAWPFKTKMMDFICI